MVVEDLRDPLSVGDAQVGEQEALVGGGPHARLEVVEDPPQRRLQPEVAGVVHPAVFDIEPIEILSISLLEPADVVVEAVNVGRMAWGQWLAEVFLDLRTEGVEAHGVDRVLEPRGLAVGAVAVVPLHLDDRLGDPADVFRGYEAEPLAEGRKGLGGTRRHAHPAAGEHVIAEDLSPFVDDEEAEVVGVDVGAVVFRECEGRLELPRQVGRAVDRLHILLA